MLAGSAWINAAAPGFLEGHLKIISPKEVELADQTPSKMTAENYAAYSLVILNPDGRKEVAQVTADGNGNSCTALSPGDYILDVQRHESGNLRVKPQPFTIVAGQTVRVDMTIVTGSSAEAIAPQE